MPSPLKVTTGNHSHTIRTSRSEFATARSTIADDLNFKGGLGVTNWRVCIAKLLSGISKSQMWEFVCYKSKKRRSPWIRNLHIIVSISYYMSRFRVKSNCKNFNSLIVNLLYLEDS